MVKAYIINLKESVDRRVYMTTLLSEFSFCDEMFIEAVDCRKKSKDDIAVDFDVEKAYNRYGRYLAGGEVGCTLSHFKCYKQIVASDLKFALILEDDITILRDFNEVLKYIQYLDTDEPTILFLSGDYWLCGKRNVDANNSVASVYDAVGSYAYLINKAACEVILNANPKPSSVADHWSLYRSQGVSLKAAYPYIVDANIEDLWSTIEQSYFGEVRKNMPFNYRLKAYWISFVKRVLLKKGNFVSKIRK